MVALARRGHNFLDTAKFRAFVSYIAHSYEPWKCSKFIGHGSGSGGGGKPFHSFLGLFRYAYPEGVLTNMLWRSNVDNLLSCYYKGQSTMDTGLFGDDSAEGARESISTVVGSDGSRMPLSIYGKERGLLISRSSLDEKALYVHVNARPDAMFVGHDNADRGSFTLTAHRHTWCPSLPWRKNFEAGKHNMVFIDGAGQYDLKAPPAAMVHVPIDDSFHVISTVNLTYATTYKWSPPWSTKNMDWTQREPEEEWEKEMSDPRDLGFSKEYADRINMPSSLWGHSDWGFAGFYQWRALYNPVVFNIRSTVLVRDHSGEPYFVIGDSIAKHDSEPHEFTWEMTLDASTNPEFEQISASCIVLSTTEAGKENVKLGLHAVSNLHKELVFETKPIMQSDKIVARRLIVKHAERQSGAIRFTVVLHPFTGDHYPDFSVYGDVDGDLLVVVNGSEKTFSMENSGHGRMAVNQKLIAPPSDTVWKPMVSDVGARPGPPPYMRFLIPDGVSHPSLTVHLMSDASALIFDPESLAHFPSGFEHIFIILPYWPGKYIFSTCEADGGHADIYFYRFTPDLTGSSGQYQAYLNRKMEKLYGLKTPTCLVEMEFDGPGLYVVQGVSNSTLLSLAYRLA